VKRRDLLALGAAAPLLAGCPFDFREGVDNPCRLEPGVSSHPLVLAAWEGLRTDQVWDMHVHLYGNGRGGKGIAVDPGFEGHSPMMRARRHFFMNAGCVGAWDDGLDARMVARLAALVDQCPLGAKVMLLAFDFPHDEAGVAQRKLATFAVTDEYARAVAASKPGRFEWMASIHPYRADAVEALEAAKRNGARAVKWLPPSMGIDMASPRCRPFFDAAKRLDIPLLIHVGEEKAAPGLGKHDFANPLLLRHPLDRGVRVIAAHCATLGESPDTDRPGAPAATCFALFERLMADRNYAGRLFGDVSAITQANRPGAVGAVLAHEEWDGRLLNGSDYPLPGVMPLFSLKSLVGEGVLDERHLPGLREIRQANALLFDFTLKRLLRVKGRGFSAKTFETRGFFEGRGMGVHG
jgi:predicted TIM-barrel fold metal-dependent hydrolase